MGATGENSAHVYDLNNSTPEIPIFDLVDPNPTYEGYFGQAVAVENTLIAVSNRKDEIFIYDLSSPSPAIPVHVINHPAFSLSMSDQILIAGNHLGRVNNIAFAGRVQGFDLSGDDPSCPFFSVDNPVLTAGWFGRSVAISDRRILVGAREISIKTLWAGVMYLIWMKLTRPNLDLRFQIPRRLRRQHVIR